MLSKWKKVITEVEKKRTWISTEQPRLLIKEERDDSGNEVYSVYLKSEEGLSYKKVAQSRRLQNAMRLAEDLGEEAITQRK